MEEFQSTQGTRVQTSPWVEEFQSSFVECNIARANLSMYTQTGHTEIPCWSRCKHTALFKPHTKTISARWHVRWSVCWRWMRRPALRGPLALASSCLGSCTATRRRSCQITEPGCSLTSSLDSLQVSITLHPSAYLLMPRVCGGCAW